MGKYLSCRNEPWSGGSDPKSGNYTGRLLWSVCHPGLSTIFRNRHGKLLIVGRPHSSVPVRAIIIGYFLDPHRVTHQGSLKVKSGFENLIDWFFGGSAAFCDPSKLWCLGDVAGTTFCRFSTLLQRSQRWGCNLHTRLGIAATATVPTLPQSPRVCKARGSQGQRAPTWI